VKVVRDRQSRIRLLQWCIRHGFDVNNMVGILPDPVDDQEWLFAD